MSGLERQFPQPLELPRTNENEQLSGSGINSLLQEYPFLPKPPNTADPHIPVLELGDFAAASGNLNFGDIPSANPAARPAEWTIAVDLTTNLMLDGTLLGAERKQQELQSLVEASKDNPDVAIAVQAAQYSPDQGLPDGTPRPDMKLDRYIIRDGMITNAETVDSQGMAANQTDLLKFATSAAPSENIGMVIQSHGAGGEGLVGDTGRVTLDQLSDAIRTGLDGSGHTTLDLLDFDSCSMSSPAVLGVVNDVADHVVASELRERGSENLNGQNLAAILTNLVQNPQTKPEELGTVFVDNANQGTVPELLNGDPFKHANADVLASYDSADYRQFSTALNELGAQLSDVAQVDQNRAQIEQLIDNTSDLPGGSNFPERRDLRQFVLGVKAAVESGELPDDAGAILRAADNVLAAQSNITEKVGRTSTGEYDNLGGMYAFLPVQDVRDGTADGPEGLRRLEQISGRESADRNDTAEKLELISNNISQKLSGGSRELFNPVIDAVNNVRNAQTDADFVVAMRALNNTVKGLLNTQVETELRDQLIESNDIPMANQWNNFTHSLAGSV